MAELTFHDVEWFAERGHPLLVLGVVDRPGEFLTVALSTGDAQALALTPTADGMERLRLLGLVESVLGQLEAQLQAVVFSVGPNRLLQAMLRINTGHQELAVPANFADAVALASRAAIPLLMTDADLAKAVSPRPGSVDVSTSSPGRAIRDFVETLDLGWIDKHGEYPANDR
jgi:bifunctional DNase/RNase